MIKTLYRYIYQINSYGCGVFAVMNAINFGMARHGYGLKHQFNYCDIPELEEVLDTDVELGTEEGPMVKFLRHYFYVTVREKFSKKKLDKWLDAGNQAIILYPYAGQYELHYSNIYKRRKSCDGDVYYSGSNIWFKKEGRKRWSMSRTITKAIIKSMYGSGSVTIYLRWRGGENES